ncbi:thyroid receptor-interacting protein 11-like isoform X2 [Tripterygium wilfordii]|uniref:thyroid receptor-interacting protein 11-like isoform X2 n=1 Tax=Tripterygium wilfordii TaxID=458696 RepID=UPI0018F845D5|nr:thyroid receptor-interacting protein 11-like isoform X2 [Tripterygium wilfordii]
MEDEKKKKRNKKKKNKQTKDVAVTSGESANENHVNNGKSDHIQASESAEAQNGVAVDTDLNINGHQPNVTEGSILADAEERLWMQREADLEDTVKQLQYENDSHNALEETIQDLRNEIGLHIEREAAFEETIKQLQNETDSHREKEVEIQMKAVQLQSEKDLWLQKEVSLEEELKQFEREKDSWIVTENTAKETTANLNRENTRLRMQVVELEEFKGSLLREKEQLLENLSALQFQVQNLERSISSAHSSNELSKYISENKDLNAQVEAASTLVEKLITENADLVEKVNELYVELERRKLTAEHPSASGSKPTLEIWPPSAGLISESHMNTPDLDQKLNSTEVVPIKDERIGIDNVNMYTAAVTPNSLEAEDSGEIVQIPLDDYEVQDLESQVVESDGKAEVPLSDSPLIGAPFRLMSFVAKYVSGADLVSKN